MVLYRAQAVFPPGVPKRPHLSRVLPNPKKEGSESARYSNIPEIMPERPKVQQIQDDKCGQGTHNELWPLPPTATPLDVLWMQGLDMRSIERSLDLDATNPAYCSKPRKQVQVHYIMVAGQSSLVGVARFFWRLTVMRWAITVQYKTRKR